MKSIRLLIAVACLAMAAFMVSVRPAVAQDADPEPDLPGLTAGTGTQFSLPNSPYLPVTLDSSVSVTLTLTSVPEIIDMMIEGDGSTESADFTLGGLNPNTVYYLYSDDTTSPATFVTDGSGSFSYTQDLTQDHYVWIRDQPSTLYLNASNGGNCASFGVWNQATLTCKMTRDVNDMIWIQSDGITLDGNGFATFGSGGNAVYSTYRSHITVKNLTTNGYANGIFFFGSGTNLTFMNNRFNGITNRGIAAAGSSITAAGNTIAANSTLGANYGILVNGSDLTISNNDIDDIRGYGIYAIGGNNVTVENNTLTSPFTIAYGILGQGSNLAITNNTIAVPFYGIIASFGTNITVEDNTVSLGQVGISVQRTTGFSIARNSLTATRNGIDIVNATGTIAQNTITKPIQSPSSGLGISLNSSGGSPTVISHNLIAGGFNTAVRFQNADSWTMTGNTIKDTYFGLGLNSGTVSAGAVYRNNFIDVTIPFANGAGPTTINASLPDGGNFYSSYNTPVQGCENLNTDSFCDSALVYAGVTDNYPWTTQDGWETPSDSTPPEITYAVSGTPGAGGWYTSDVTVTWSVTDGESTPTYVCPDTTIDYDTDGVTLSCNASSDGGEAGPVFVTIKRDATKPTAGASVAAPNSSGWYNSDVTVSFSGTDALSGIASCTAPVTLSGEGTGQSAVGTCTDNAGNVSDPAVAAGINIDKTEPDLTVNKPETQYTVQPLGFALDFLAVDQTGLSGLDASSPAATLTNADGSVTVSSGYEPGVGVYTVVFYASDLAGNTRTSDEYVLVIFDENGGFVTGGGWIDSPAGAYLENPTLTGKATFGFVAKYKKGASVPDGNTQFQFRAGDLNFHSSSYEWLVVAAHKALFKGEGTINGESGYGFLISAVDESQHASIDTDRFRIKIWKISDESVIYDNQMGAADDAEATTDIGGGSIVIHTRGK